MMNGVKRVLKVYYEDLVSAVQASAFVPIFLRRRFLLLIGVRAGVGTYINPGVRFHRANISFGRRCVIGAGVFFDCSGRIVVGDRVNIAAGTLILSATHEITSSVFRRDLAQVDLLETRIDRGCWIGARSVVLPGVSIGEGCVIGSGSVVVSDCAPNGLYIGTPAKRVKDLPVEFDVPLHDGVPLSTI